MIATASGKGTVGKLITDDQLYNQANSAIEKLNNIATRLDNGEGSAGKLLKDEALYKSLNAAIANTFFPRLSPEFHSNVPHNAAPAPPAMLRSTRKAVSGSK